MAELSIFEKKLLNLLQGEIPICNRPFAKIAEKLQTDEKIVIEKIRELKAAGYLRRIGTFFDSNKLGYRGVLVALKVEQNKIFSVANAINNYSGATHNYEREGKFNLWFTLLSANAEQEKKILSEIKKISGVREMIILKANKKYKINVQFKLK